MKRFFVGFVAGALSLFLGLAYWRSYQNVKAMKQMSALFRTQVDWMKRGSPHE